MFFSPYNRTLRNSAFSVGLSLLLFFSPSVGSAQSANVEIEDSPFSVSDLTPQQFSALASVAPVLLGATGSSGNITNDVAAILTLLQRVKQDLNSNVSMFRTFVFTPLGQNVADFLGPGMYESYTGTSRPSQSNSLLFEIQRALYGQNGVPSANRALLPFLYSAYGFTNALYSSSSGDSVGDMLRPVYSFYDEAESAQLDPWQIAAFFDSIPSVPGTWSDLWNVLYMGNSNLIAAGFSDAPAPYEGTGLYVMEGAINDVWRESSSDVSGSDSALQVVDPVVAEQVYNLQSYLAAIESAVRTSGGGSASSYNITNTITYDNPGSDDISEGQFGLSAIGVNLRESYGSLLTNRLPASIGAVNTNEIFALTNAAMAAMPNLTPVQNFIQDSLSPFDAQNVGTGPEIRIFQTFTHDGITIPGMSLDLSDSRFSLLRERCNWLARFSYGLLFLVLTILRIRSFLDYVIAGFSTLYGGEIEASSSAEGFRS